MIAAPAGTVMVTFHGASARIPACYALLHQQPEGVDWLRVWVRRDGPDDGHVLLEDGDLVVRRPR